MKRKMRFTLEDGLLVFVTTNNGVIILNGSNKGKDTEMPVSNGGNLSFQIRRPVGQTGNTVVNVRTDDKYNQGYARGSVTINFQ